MKFVIIAVAIAMCASVSTVRFERIKSLELF